MIDQKGEIVEIDNPAPDPSDQFELPLEALETATATWHSHPHSTGNLSIPDYWFFKSWPHLTHFIIDETSVWCYLIANGEVIVVNDEADYPARPSG